MTILITILIYFCILLLFSKMTSRKANNDTFYRADRRSPWYMVAFGMVGASISGITFISVPGMVIRSDMTYLQMCLGFIVGYFLVAFLLLPVYYKFNLTTIYSYLQHRLCITSLAIRICSLNFFPELEWLVSMIAAWLTTSILSYISCRRIKSS